MNVARCTLDHLIVVAPTLEAGSAYIHDVLGVSPQAGGQHARMGTHNRLLRLGDGIYLEVIAIDPDAPAPARPRWFALDARGADFAPTLAAWVARTTDIAAANAAATESLGTVEPMSRGALEWLITMTPDGSVPLDGVGPGLIEWRVGGHPTSRLEDHGLALAALEITHPDPARVTRLLGALALEGEVTVRAGPPGLVARIETPRGQGTLA
ncbi:VOC family protein [Usitatibacter palustris]|uniref:Glyoxalase-like domain-containing protein n=1 Tax=Usitatibacter palustris TaxID=2732487 RepID=A0A6M4H3D6_9PROT|nr:VOC family protein [Usitatibacter palustris]QJR13588.1 hypothetical protein DSM104440_00372 [Usitatibacter palustris]